MIKSRLGFSPDCSNPAVPLQFYSMNKWTGHECQGGARDVWKNIYFLFSYKIKLFSQERQCIAKKKKDEHDLEFSVYVFFGFCLFVSFLSMFFFCIQKLMSHTFFSVFCAAWGTITGSSNSLVRTFPRLPSVKIVERFFRAIFAENILVNSQELQMKYIGYYE